MQKLIKRFLGIALTFATIAALVLPTALRVQAANEVLLDTQVRINTQPVQNPDGTPNCSGGGAQWSYQVNARRGETVEFFIHVHNNTTQTSTRTVLRDTLPAGLEYVAGTSRIWSDNTCKKWTDGLVSQNGIIAQDTRGGGDIYFQFRARVKDTATGRQVQNGESWVTIGGQTFYNSNSNAEVTVYGYGQGQPALTIDTKGFNPRVPQGGPQDVIDLRAGDQVQFWSYIGNTASDPNAPASLAKNVRIKYTLPSGATREVVVTGETWADNAGKKSDTARAFPTEALRLEFVKGSAKAYNAQTGAFLANLGDEIVTTGALLGDQLPSAQPAKYVVIEAKAVGEPTQKGSIKVIKFKDVNGNGQEDAGEPRMSGVLFHLDMGTPNEREATTNQSGEILWNDVTVGSHQVHEVVPTGFTVTTPNPQTVNAVANQTVTVKFGNRPVVSPQQAKLEIIKIKDANANGICEKGEPGMEGVKFTIKKNNEVITTGTTNAAGLVEFDLDPGTYQVFEEVPEGFEVIGENPQTVTLADNDDKALAFCNKPKEVQPKKANILVIKFKDLDGDGTQDAGEPRLSGVIFTANGIMQKTTDTNGEARWVELDLGQYVVRETVPNGFRATTPTEQTAVLDENGETVTLAFGNQPVELPPTGAFNLLLPSSMGALTTLYAMVRRQRRYVIELLRNI